MPTYTFTASGDLFGIANRALSALGFAPTTLNTRGLPSVIFDFAAPLTADELLQLQQAMQDGGFGGQNSGTAMLAVTTAERDALVPFDGALVFNTDAGVLQVYRNATWHSVADMDVVQPILLGKKVGWWTALGNSTTTTQINLGNATTGTAQARNVAATNFSTSLRRIAYVSGGAAGSSCGTRHNAAQFYRGDVAGRGGFLYSARIVIDTVQANMRWFAGMRAATAVIGNVDPSTLVDMIGFGIDSGQTTVRFFHNDAAGVATAIDLGAGFPAATAGVVYEIRLFSAPNGADITYTIKRLDAAGTAQAAVAVDIPAPATLLSPALWMNNGTTAAAVALAVMTQYVETDN